MAQVLTDSRHRIAILALDGVVPFDVGAATQVFRHATDDAGTRLYHVAVTTPDGGAVRSSAGFLIQPEQRPDVLAAADTIVVPGIAGNLLEAGWRLSEEVATALRERAELGCRLMSICTGAFVLAAAGLLKGRPATTHWWHTKRFQRWFPDVRLDPDVLFVDDGDVLTSAGVGAGVDLCLHVVRRDHGSEVANRTARLCVVPPWREGGQAQFIERPLPTSPDASTAPVRAFILENLGERLVLARLAAYVRMSVRTFTRRFREETGMSPGAWILAQRVQRARHLLEATDLPIDQIARDAGFGSSAAMRQHLHQVLGVSPAAYRRTFAR